MDNFIEKLQRHITDLSDSEDVVAYNKAVTMLESLGEHSKNMLQVGILQEKLIEMGFEWCGNMALLHTEYYDVVVTFSLYWVCVKDCSHQQTFPYDSPTWQQDLLSYVKGKINA